MYERGNTFFTKEEIGKTPTTPGILALADAFNREINFGELSARARKALEQRGCETIGDAYFFVTEDGHCLGQATKEEILLHVMCAFMPCKYAIDVEKAYQLSQHPANYEMVYFRGSSDTGLVHVTTMLDREDFSNDDSFLQALVLRGELDEDKLECIVEITQLNLQEKQNLEYGER